MRVRNAVRVCAAMQTDVMSYQALNLANQIRLLGDAPNTPERKEFSRMSELLFFIIGIILGSLIGVMLMCMLQINRLSQREDEQNAKTKRTDTFPS